jgi:hypothetical protein
MNRLAHFAQDPGALFSRGLRAFDVVEKLERGSRHFSIHSLCQYEHALSQISKGI